MTRGSPVLLLLIAASCSGVSSRVEEVPPELRTPAAVIPPVSDRWPYPLAPDLSPGAWARYREGGGILKLAVVGKEEDGVWIETILEGDPLQASAALVAPDGAVRKAYYCEVSREGKTGVSPQALVQSPGAPPGSMKERSRETGEEKVAVGGRELVCRLERIRYEDLEGRLLEETVLWHPEVPRVREGSDRGGLVRRKSSRADVELLDFGKDARPVVDRPK
jgi:hypothetical protein